jgi:hypothetical protein
MEIIRNAKELACRIKIPRLFCCDERLTKNMENSIWLQCDTCNTITLARVDV